MIDQERRALTAQYWARFYRLQAFHYAYNGLAHKAKRYQRMAAKEYAKARRIMGIS